MGFPKKEAHGERKYISVRPFSMEISSIPMNKRKI